MHCIVVMEITVVYHASSSYFVSFSSCFSFFQKETKNLKTVTSRRKLDPSELVGFLLDRHHKRLEAEAYDVEPTEQDTSAIQEEAAKMAEEGKLNEAEAGEEEEEKKKEPPLHVKSVKEVLERYKLHCSRTVF